MSDPSKVLCAGCGRVIGLTESVSPVPRLYCNERCLNDYPISPNEVRDDKIFQLLHAKVPKGQIAEQFGLSRQRIIQMANARKKEGTLGD